MIFSFFTTQRYERIRLRCFFCKLAELFSLFITLNKQIMKQVLKSWSVFSLVVAFFALFTATTNAQVTAGGKTCVGTWKTIDDETGETKSHVQIEERGGKYYGKIVKLLSKDALTKSKTPDNPTDILCDKCGGAKKDKPILGMEILWNMEKYSDKYGGGNILDPKKGSEYSCTMWMESADVLKVRGWWGFLYRTQTWYRVN